METTQYDSYTDDPYGPPPGHGHHHHHHHHDAPHDHSTGEEQEYEDLNATQQSYPDVHGHHHHDESEPHRHHRPHGHRPCRQCAPSYNELANQTHVVHQEYKEYPTKPPRPENLRMADTFYQEPQPPKEDKPSGQQQFFERSLTQVDTFPLHTEKLLGIKRPKKQVVEQPFGDSPMGERRPNYQVPKKRKAAQTRDFNAFYEGRTTGRNAQSNLPGTVFMSPGMEVPPPVVDGEVQTSPPSLTRTRGRGFEKYQTETKTRSFGDDGWTAAPQARGGEVTEEAVLYKHKRSYNHDFPPMADRIHPEQTAKERKMMASTLPSLRGGEAKPKKSADEDQIDENCTFRPRSLQKPTAFYPEYATGKTVSSTYAQYGQVSYMLPDSSALLKANQKNAKAQLSAAPIAGQKKRAPLRIAQHPTRV
ncbi:hypothetical protein BLNAU_13913 [Blattamonas nauphoetae]|uniref:Uncharacterized protein n=1 Tax=Blattamonas nauphoetae TaxID=2049346 RepID=A0ABQ9XM06_9EUKA|nr:hypothetical protein BLNAU_13913 [Blattamonas nauphoetae]